MFELKNKVAVVTGGAEGIGFGLVKELLRRELKGVAIIDINEEYGAKALREINEEFKDSKRAIFIKTDVSNRKQLENAFDTVVKTYNQFDILFNNAGITDEIQVDRCLLVNVAGAIIGTQLAIEKYFPKYRSSYESLVVNMSSIVYLHPMSDLPVYTSTKFALIGFTKAMASSFRYKTSKTRIIALCPGAIDTPLLHVFSSETIPEPYYSRQVIDVKRIRDANMMQMASDFAKDVMDVIPDAPTGSLWKFTVEGYSRIE